MYTYTYTYEPWKIRRPYSTQHKIWSRIKPNQPTISRHNTKHYTHHTHTPQVITIWIHIHIHTATDSLHRTSPTPQYAAPTNTITPVSSLSYAATPKAPDHPPSALRYTTQTTAGTIEPNNAPQTSRDQLKDLPASLKGQVCQLKCVSGSVSVSVFVWVYRSDRHVVHL